MIKQKFASFYFYAFSAYKKNYKCYFLDVFNFQLSEKVFFFHCFWLLNLRSKSRQLINANKLKMRKKIKIKNLLNCPRNSFKREFTN